MTTTLAPLTSPIRSKKQPKLLVNGCPRTGFTLLLSILGRLIDRQGYKPDPFRARVREVMDEATQRIDQAGREYFADHIDVENLVISPEFGLLVGGPKWLDPEEPETTCRVRKYVGIKDSGDFLAVFKMPKFAMDYYDIIHSHYKPKSWLDDPYYADYTKLASIRSPLDVLNSATFSLNALTGHYIDEVLKRPTTPIREHLALYKLTDMNFVEGLVAPQVKYWTEFLEVRDQYAVMRWEDLIRDPRETILKVAASAGLPCTPDEATGLWSDMSYRNQTRWHVHNFRKGVIDDHRNHLVNEHLEVLEAAGFNEFLTELGYAPIEYFDPKDYTLFQRKVAECLQSGRPHPGVDDPNVFIFAFNKSNFQSTKFDFVSYPGHGDVEIERSSIKDEPLLNGFAEVVDAELQATYAAMNSTYAECSR